MNVIHSLANQLINSTRTSSTTAKNIAREKDFKETESVRLSIIEKRRPKQPVRSEEVKQHLGIEDQGKISDG